LNAEFISTKWQVRKGAVESGDITLGSVAKMVVHHVLKTESEYENSFTTLEQKTSVMRDAEVYRFDRAKEKHTLISGKSVMPDWARKY
jgi:hypothetical protein